MLVFNGEIYNYRELRRRLEESGEEFRGASDTEVLLLALDRWGIEGTLPLLNGMWAFAWADVSAGRVVLCRDRFGEKPLHVAVREGRVMFASDIRALLAMTSGTWPLNHRAVASFLQLGLINTGYETFFDGIFQVPAASWMEFRDVSVTSLPTPRCYWKCPVEAEPRSLSNLIDETRSLLLDSVRLRLRSDVPVGLLLSGGLDSSSIAAAVRALGGNSVSAFSLVDSDPDVDESRFIDSVAARLEMPVRKVRLPEEPESLAYCLEAVVDCMGAPFSSLSNVAHWLLMREARDCGTTVVMSGQGGDEILCGYRKYLGFYLQARLRQGRIAGALGTAAMFAIRGALIGQFDHAQASRYLPPSLRRDWRGNRLGPATKFVEVARPGLLPGETVPARQRRDLMELSVPTLTHYEDRTSMAFSREIRLPFLDHRLAELLVPAPAHQKLHQGWSKFPLRAAFEPELPAEVTWRPDKRGFSSPEAKLLRTSLRRHFEERMLSPSAFVYRAGLLDFATSAQGWRSFCSDSKGRGWSRDFVCALTLESWMCRHAERLSW